MSTTFASAVQGTLRSNAAPPGGQSIVTVRNRLFFPITVIWVDESGISYPLHPCDLPPDGAVRIASHSGSQFIAASALTGGLIGVISIAPGQDRYYVAPPMLQRPNHIGMPPRPDAPTDAGRMSGLRLLPDDSPRVVVGCGRMANGGVLLREQYWRRTAASFTLAPGESRQVSITQSQGLERTSSSQESVQSALSVGVSAGWGGISASISASLNKSSSSAQQVTITEQTTRLEQTLLENKTEQVRTFFVWQLIDALTIFSKDLQVLGAIMTGQQPSLVDGPYALGAAAAG